MFVRRLCLLLGIAIPMLGQASDGVIRFRGTVLEATCIVQTGQIDKNENATLNTCSKHVAASTTVSTEIVRPNAYLLAWRANDTPKADVPVTQWKLIQISYH